MFQAVSYYETALKTDALDCCLSIELSELLLKLKRLEEAQQVLEKALEHQTSNYNSNKHDRSPRETGIIVLRLIIFLSAFAATALTTMMNDVKVLRVLVKVLRARNESALDVVQKVCEYFHKLYPMVGAHMFIYKFLGSARIHLHYLQ